MPVDIYPLGDSAAVIQFGNTIDPKTHGKVMAMAALLDEEPLPGMIEYVPAFASITVFFDSFQIFRAHFGKTRLNRDAGMVSPFEIVSGCLREMAGRLVDNTEREPLRVEIPVCYGGDLGPDLETVADYHGLKPQDVVDIHSGGEYLVYMIGFAPGFPYLGGLPESIATPRRKTPRLSIPAGSVGIAGRQTGIYPIETPGGWQLIGRTPLRLFRPGQDPPTLLRAGQTVKFVPISREEFDRWKDEVR